MKKVLKSLSISATAFFLFVVPVMADGEVPDESERAKLDTVITQFVNWAAVLAGLIALAFLIIAGIKYVTSSGDPGKTEEAQKQIISAIIGLAIVVLSYTILRVVLYLFGVGFGASALKSLGEAGATDLLP